MANINLATSKEKDSGDNFFASSQGAIVMLFIFLMLAYGTLLLYGYYLDSKVEKMRANYGTVYNSFISGDSKKVLDFQNRIAIASEASKSEKNALLDLAELEKVIINGVSIEKYAYDNGNGTITLSCLTGNYGLIAKQIQSLKASDYFILASAGESKFESTKGRINFSIVLKANKSDKTSL